jgi:Peptidase family M23
MTVRPPQHPVARMSLYLQRHARRLLVAVAVSGLVLPLLPVPAAPVMATPTAPAERPASPGSGTTPTSVPVVPLGAFPVQGPCSFTDTWGAPRSGGRVHEGVDIIAKSGQYVYAVVDGTLSKQAVDKPGGLSGNAWWLTTSDRSYYFYAHLSGFAPDLKVGSKVVAGQIIGYVGMTGNAAAPHLHFEIHPGGGSAINPTPSVKAVDGCKNTTPLPQPGETPTTDPGSTTTAPTPPVNGATDTAGGSTWSFVSPQTAFDSAWGSGRVTGKRTIKVSGMSGIGNTAGVLTRITASNATAAGFLIVHPCNTDGAGVASLTFPAGATAVGTAPVEVVSGNICVTTNVAVNLKLDILAIRSANGVGLRPIPATRALDSRTTGTRLTPGAQIAISANALGVVPGTQALSATISLVDPSAAGSITIGLCNGGSWTVPTSSDYLSSFAIVMRVSSTGWCLKSSITTDVIVDVTGIWTGTAGPLPIPATRVLDSRITTGPIGPDPVTIQVAGQGTIPTGTSAVMLALTTVAGDGQAIVFATPCGQPRGTGVVTATNPNRITTVIVPAALTNGTLCISAIQPTHIVIDVLAAG